MIANKINAGSISKMLDGPILVTQVSPKINLKSVGIFSYKELMHLDRILKTYETVD